MGKSKPDTHDPATLRRRAEQRHRELAGGPEPSSDADPRRLLHELEVHQIELEMQNEELRAARQEIEAGLQRYTELFDFAPVGYVVLGRTGDIQALNLACAHLLGAERLRLVGQPFASFIAVEQSQDFRRFLASVFVGDGEEHGVRRLEVSLATGLVWRSVALTGVLVLGAVPTALVAIEDVTERKQAEEVLREEARRKDEFLAVLSHELRGPLAPIRNGLYVLARTGVGGGVAEKALEIVNRQVGHLARMVDDLLDMTRIARGKVTLHLERIELGEAARRAIDDHRESLELNGIELTARFDGGLMWVDADPTRLAQILGNLLVNASKFTGRGGTVEVGLQQEGQQAVLSVRDSGAGIAPDVLPHLFQPFSQAPQTIERTRGGLGLGLAMVKGLVGLHGGSVDVTSEGLGRGAEFTIRLPVQKPPTRDAAIGGSAPARGLRVLIIEDGVDAADTLRDALQLAGHDVRVAYDGPTGLASAREFVPDTVLCDIGLPGMDGCDVARAIRNDAAVSHAYLVALSGYAQAEDVHRATEAGFDAHVAKPVYMDALLKLLSAPPPDPLKPDIA